MRFWVGGYTADGEGSAEGIGVLHAGAPDSALAGGDLAFTGVAARTDSPSWVAAHPTLDVLYVAQEAAGTVQAFTRTGEETFAPLGGAVDAGDFVCHVAVAPTGDAVIVSEEILPEGSADAQGAPQSGDRPLDDLPPPSAASGEVEIAVAEEPAFEAAPAFEPAEAPAEVTTRPGPWRCTRAGTSSRPSP